MLTNKRSATEILIGIVCISFSVTCRLVCKPLGNNLSLLQVNTAPFSQILATYFDSITDRLQSLKSFNVMRYEDVDKTHLGLCWSYGWFCLCLSSVANTGVQLCAVFEVSAGAGARMPSYLSSACSEELPGSLHTQSHGDSLYEKIINDPGFWVYCSSELRE